LGFPPACPPSYGAPDCYPGRTDSCRTHQPFLDAQPCLRLSPHTAQVGYLEAEIEGCAQPFPVAPRVRLPEVRHLTCPVASRPHFVIGQHHLAHVSHLSAGADAPVRPVMSSRCLSAAGIRFLGHRFPLVGFCLPYGRLTDGGRQTTSGFPRSAPARRDWGGRPLCPGAFRCPDRAPGRRPVGGRKRIRFL